MTIDLSLYLVVGPGDTRGRDMLSITCAAVAGGVTAVQLRRKDANVREFVEQARALGSILRGLGVPLIVNDRVDVALAADADGVHLGQTDLVPLDARRLLGPERIVGLSVTTVAEALDVDARVVDYVGVGPVFATSTKLDAAPPLGVEGARAVCAVVRVPTVAIGGISRGNAAAVLATGVGGLAVVSAVCGADDPMRAARELRAFASPSPTNAAYLA